MILYVIRHGETEWNRLKKLQGQKDIMLNDEGIRLAALTGQAMRDIPIDLAITSPLIRAKQTAQLVLTNRSVPIITDERIKEMSFGEWEGESTRESKILPKEFITDFHDNPLHCIKPPKGESFADVVERTKAFYESLIRDGGYEKMNILISTHGAASRCLLNNFYEDKEDIWRGCIPANCSVSIVNVENGVGNVEELDKIYY